MTDDLYFSLTERERSVLDALERVGRGSVAEITRALPGATGDAVRAALRVLRQKGLVQYGEDGRRYVYELATPQVDAQVSAVSRLVRTVFGGSRSRAMAALLRLDDPALRPEELDRLAAEIDEAERRARRGGDA
ncbi:MAG TPA: BlaI/MecI/CopY family transcriptional regulator [Longimicrobium sp.]|jgi:predicted transcriptional regulator|uniref:BlaI/MecI/CopY family transcriptional regulator n=1 Tax=Longimicrobium sp. TaxID=2029185 RepID=UPI002EDB96F7